MINVKSNGRALVGRLSKVGRKQLPFAAARALTWTAKDGAKAVSAHFKRMLDRPRAFTVKSPYFRPATKAKLRAVVDFRQFAGKGNPAGKYLKSLEDGGARKHKRFEKALIARGHMRANEYAVPAKSLRLNSYGNVTGAMISKILSRLGASSDGHQNATSASHSRRGRTSSEYFVPSASSGLPRGVWRRMARRKVKPVFIFVQGAPTYRRRIMFDAVVKREAQRKFPEHFKRSFSMAMGMG